MATLTYTVSTVKKANGCYILRSDGKVSFLQIKRRAGGIAQRICNKRNFTHIVCWDKKYTIGDDHSFSSIPDLESALKAERKTGNDYFIKPVYLHKTSVAGSNQYEYSLSTTINKFSVSAHLAGFAYVYRKSLVERGVITYNEDVWRKKASSIIDEEVDSYSRYMNSKELYSYTEFIYSNGNWNQGETRLGFQNSDIELTQILYAMNAKLLDVKNERELMKRWREFK